MSVIGIDKGMTLVQASYKENIKEGFLKHGLTNSGLAKTKKINVNIKLRKTIAVAFRHLQGISSALGDKAYLPTYPPIS